MDKNTKIVLLTGGTGSFGKFLAQELLKHKNVKLLLPIRGTSHEDVSRRAKDITGNNNDQIEAFPADLTEAHLGLSTEKYKELSGKITHILHSAASTRFNLSLEEARLHNVKMTANILEFAKNCTELTRFGYLSTALVSGRRTGVIMEDEFEHNAGFSNSYQQTKYEAEDLVRTEAGKLPIVIFRPPLIIGPSAISSGDQKRPPNFLALLVSLIASGQITCVPGAPESTWDLVEAHDASWAIVELMLKEKLSYLTYHITNGSQALTVGMLHKAIEEFANKKIPIEYCGSVDAFMTRIAEISKNRPEIKEIYRRAESFLLEPAYPKEFDNSHLLTELNKKQLGKEPINTLRLAIKHQSWSLSE